MKLPPEQGKKSKMVSLPKPTDESASSSASASTSTPSAGTSTPALKLESSRTSKTAKTSISSKSSKTTSPTSGDPGVKPAKIPRDKSPDQSKAREASPGPVLAEPDGM